MRFRDTGLIMLSAALAVTGCVSQQPHRVTAQRPARNSAAAPAREESIPPAAIEYHADPPSGPSQPVPETPTAEVETPVVRGISLSRLIHKKLHPSSCGSEPTCATEQESCGETKSCLPRPPSSSKCLRMPKLFLWKGRCSRPGCAGTQEDECVVECSPGDTCALKPACEEGCSKRSTFPNPLGFCRVPAVLKNCFHFPTKAPACGEACAAEPTGCGDSETIFIQQDEDVELPYPLTELPEDPFVEESHPPVPEPPQEATPSAELEMPIVPQPPAIPVEPTTDSTGLEQPQKPAIAPLAPMPVSVRRYIEPGVWPRVKLQSEYRREPAYNAGWPAGSQSGYQGMPSWQIR